MQIIAKCFRLSLLILVVSFTMNVSLNAQTPSDDPSIVGGPGTFGSTPAGDGAPIVPFDDRMSVMLALIGIGYVVNKLQNPMSIKVYS